MKRKSFNCPGRDLIERDCEQLFGMGFGALCKTLGLNTNATLARIRRGIPITVVLSREAQPQHDCITITATKVVDHD
jgi:hypothetical protein